MVALPKKEHDRAGEWKSCCRAPIYIRWLFWGYKLSFSISTVYNFLQVNYLLFKGQVVLVSHFPSSSISPLFKLNSSR